VFRKVVELSRKYNVFLHAHSDANAVDRIFRQYPGATVLWAHSGFAEPDARWPSGSPGGTPPSCPTGPCK